MQVSLDQVVQVRQKIEEELEELHKRLHSSGGDLYISLLQVRNISITPIQKASLSISIKGDVILQPRPIEIGMDVTPLQISILDDNIDIILQLQEEKKLNNTDDKTIVEHTVEIKLLNKLVDGKLPETRDWFVCDSDIDESLSKSTATDVTETPQFYVSLKFARNPSPDSGLHAEQIKALRSRYEEVVALENMLRSQGYTSVYDVKPLWTPIPKPENLQDKLLYPFRFGLGVLDTSGQLIYKNRAVLMFIGGALLFHLKGDEFAC